MFDVGEYRDKIYQEIDKARNKGLSPYGLAIRNIEDLLHERQKIYNEVLKNKGNLKIKHREALMKISLKLEVWLKIAIKEGQREVDKDHKQYKNLIKEIKQMKANRKGSLGKFSLNTKLINAKRMQQHLKMEIGRLSDYNIKLTDVTQEAKTGIPAQVEIRQLIRSFIEEQKKMGMMNDYLEELSAQIDELTTMVNVDDLQEDLGIDSSTFNEFDENTRDELFD